MVTSARLLRVVGLHNDRSIWSPVTSEHTSVKVGFLEEVPGRGAA